jgi:hypothetical protein
MKLKCKKGTFKSGCIDWKVISRKPISVLRSSIFNLEISRTFKDDVPFKDSLNIRSTELHLCCLMRRKASTQEERHRQQHLKLVVFRVLNLNKYNFLNRSIKIIVKRLPCCPKCGI